MPIRTNFHPDDWERIYQDWTAWWEGEIDRPMIVIENCDPTPKRKTIPPPLNCRPAEYPLDTPVDLVIDYYEDLLERMHYYGDAMPKWWLDFGPGIMAGFLGARVMVDRSTVWFQPLEHRDIEKLQFTYDPHNVWWERIREISRRAVERWGDQVCVGHADLGGNLDILASFRTTQQLLLDLYDAPEEVTRLSIDITRLWLRYYEELYKILKENGRGTTPWAYIWSPTTCYMMQCDFAYMISPRMFERFVLPDLVECCEHMEHGFYHMDGIGQIPHLDLLCSIERLRGIQWIPGDGSPPPEEWLPLLKRIVDSGKRCQINLSCEGALKVVKELGGKGFAIWIRKDENMAEEDIQAFMTQMRLVDSGRK